MIKLEKSRVKRDTVCEAVLLEAELERLRAERAKAHSALKEIRLRLHTAGRRPEECYEMRLIDGVLL